LLPAREKKRSAQKGESVRKIAIFKVEQHSKKMMILRALLKGRVSKQLIYLGKKNV